jgi:pilus assembly protein FimV
MGLIINNYIKQLDSVKLMNNYKILFKLILTACLGFYAVTGYSLALSETELKSHINQQLDIRIKLIVADAAELDDLSISLSYSATKSISRYQLKYEVIKSDEGNFLKITSNDVIREPIIEFTLDIGWSDGRLVREYSFLIDLPRN